MEQVSGRHYIYNPYILSLLYAKVMALSRLRELYLREVGPHNRPAVGLVRDNLYDRMLVADVYYMMLGMKDESFHFDLYYANFEYMLLRMLHLFLPHQCNVKMEMGDLFRADMKCLELMEEGGVESRAFLTDAVLAYVGEYYFRRLSHYEEEASKRTTLLLNVKRTAEKVLRERRGRDRDYVIHYTKDVVTTMLYLFFLNEFLCLTERERASSTLTHQSLFLESCESECGWTERERERARLSQEMERRILLLERLREGMARQYEDELGGWSVVSVFPNRPTHVENHFSLYNLVGCAQSRVNEVLRKGGGPDFLVREVKTHNLRYLNIMKNRAHYEFMTRRIIFDQEVRLLHRGHRRSTCYICRYASHNEALFEFYHQCEQCAYNTCHYVERNSPLLENEACLHRFLATVMIELLPALHSVIYKNLWQLQHLFAASDLRIQHTEYTAESRLSRKAEYREGSLFHMLDVSALVRYILSHYDDELGGGQEARITLVLQQCKQRSSQHVSNTVITEWHIKLAIDVDMVLLVMRGMAEQEAEIERYERSLTEGVGTVVLHDSLASTRGCYSQLTRILTEIYCLYTTELSNALRLR